MTPDNFTIYNNELTSLVNKMFEEFDVKEFLTPESKKTMIRDGRPRLQT